MTIPLLYRAKSKVTSEFTARFHCHAMISHSVCKWPRSLFCFFCYFLFSNLLHIRIKSFVPVQNAEPRRRKPGKLLCTAARDFDRRSLQQFSTATILQEHFHFGHQMGENVAAIISTVFRLARVRVQLFRTSKTTGGEKKLFSVSRHFATSLRCHSALGAVPPPPPVVFPFCNLKHPPLKNDAANYST